jgi:uncharacterized protein YgiB involved in biofilm formation
MKRSRHVSILFMGLGAVGLSGCGESNTDVYVYKNPGQCVEDKRGTERECETAFTQARAEHMTKAPRYEDKADCEKEFGVGKCEDTGSGSSSSSSPSSSSSFFSSSNRRTAGSSFVPYMVGYMMGSRTSAVQPQPLYQFQGQNTYRTPGGGTIPAVVGSSGIGQRTVPSSNVAPAVRAATVSRGGFGASALSVAHSSST